MVELRNISKSYGTLQVLRDVSLVIPEGKVTAIVGPSGAGKTTLLQIAGTLDRPDSGQVLFDSVDVACLNDRKLSAFRNSNIGFVFQFHQLLNEFSALENVAIPAMIGGKSKGDALGEAKKLLCQLGLADRLSHKPSELSGGERQRTAIARALVNRPKVVFADEPTGSLDSHNRADIHKVIADLRDGMGQTFVVVTHDTDMALTSDITVDMADGMIVAKQ